MQAYAVWRLRPVFISSTFRDMHAERDYLRNHVFQELEERLKERFHHLEPIDLHFRGRRCRGGRRNRSGWVRRRSYGARRGVGR